MNDQNRIAQENQLREPFQRLNNKEQEEIQKLIMKIQTDDEIVGMIRYGSSVKSEAYKDIDLCLVSRNSEISSKKEFEYRTFLSEKFDVHFYLVSILFIIFDLEISFLFLWGVVFEKIYWFGYFTMCFFLILLTI